MDKHDIIIIGAGISGLSLAHYCTKAGLKTLVIEKSERVGGTFHSHHIQGFWLELGAHTCYNSYRNLIGIIEDCHILDHLVRREKVPFRMLVGNQIKSISSRLNLLELLLHAPRMFSLQKAGQTVESYYSKIVGKRNFDRVFQHVFNAVPCQRANDFPADMLFKKRPRRKDIIKSFTLARGIASITNAIASQQGIEVLAGKEVEDIHFGDDLFQITAKDKSTYKSGMLALATPAPVAAQLLRTPFPEISQQIAQIKVATVESVGVAIRRDLLSLEAVAGIVPTDDSFYSVVSRDTVRHNNYRGFTFHFKPGLIDLESKLKRIGEVLGVQRDQLVHVITKENIVPSPGLGHDTIINTINRLITGKPLLLTGNYFSGIAIEDCVSRSLREFKRLMMVKKQFEDY